MSDEPKRPYYETKQQQQKPQPKPANVTPVKKWTIADVLFWGRDENGKPKKPNQ